MDDYPQLPFFMTEVHRDRKPTNLAPFHGAGGDWVFFDGLVGGRLPFTFGLTLKEPMEPANGLLIGHAPDTGAELVAHFGEVFHTDPPKAPRKAFPLQPLHASGILMGKGMAREQGGTLSDSEGSWYASKWTVVAGKSGSADFFLTFSLDEMAGEFSEASESDRGGLLEALAVAFRDGKK